MKKTVLVTGTSSGIGKATVFEFAKMGWNVIATQRNPENELDFNKLPNVKMYSLDVTNLESIKQTISQAQKDFGKIDVVVNNAGYGVDGAFEAMSDEIIEKQFNTNVFGLMRVTREAIKHMRPNGGGMIIQISSMGGKITFRSNKFVVVILSAIGGILPIEGRVTVSAGLLDTVAPKKGPGREKLGIVDYLATHHYYLWSPLEKTVILPIAAFGLTYAAWLGMIAPLLIVSLLFISWYIWSQVHDEQIVIPSSDFKMSSVSRNVLPMFIAIGAYIYKSEWMVACFGFLTLYYVMISQQWNIKKLLSYVRWDVLAWVGAVIVLGNYMKSYDSAWQNVLKTSVLDPHTLLGMTIISAIGFTSSFLMGSSGKFIAIAVIMAQVFGVQYFLWFFALDFAGYLLSPMHKCVMIGNRYFGTPVKTYYKALGAWAGLLLITAGVLTFLL